MTHLHADELTLYVGDGEVDDVAATVDHLSLQLLAGEGARGADLSLPEGSPCGTGCRRQIARGQRLAAGSPRLFVVPILH